MNNCLKSIRVGTLFTKVVEIKNGLHHLCFAESFPNSSKQLHREFHHRCSPEKLRFFIRITKACKLWSQNDANADVFQRVLRTFTEEPKPYSGNPQTSIMCNFTKIVKSIVFNYCYKAPHLRCLWRSWRHPWELEPPRMLSLKFFIFFFFLFHKSCFLWHLQIEHPLSVPPLNPHWRENLWKFGP